MNTSYFCYKDFIKMDSMIGEKESDLWDGRAKLMSKDRFPAIAYAPPVPMRFVTLLYLRRN